ncbi:YajQ family cyclic di-GMP-binding protein [Candidatus Saccharibacteria bacterium]|nr:YajQ family cyclic di-GMP-binding protein [Candidatus Saccharibacteria bacterium]
MANFSFDITSEYDKAEMNNGFESAKREIGQRFDFKGTPADLEWMEDKKGVKVFGNSDWQVESVLDIFIKNISKRGVPSLFLDQSKENHTNNMKVSKEVSFVEGLDAEKAKKVTKLIRDEFPKVKTQIQGQEVRVMSGSKDDLQAVMMFLKGQELGFAVGFGNYR